MSICFIFIESVPTRGLYCVLCSLNLTVLASLINYQVLDSLLSRIRGKFGQCISKCCESTLLSNKHYTHCHSFVDNMIFDQIVFFGQLYLGYTHIALIIGVNTCWFHDGISNHLWLDSHLNDEIPCDLYGNHF